MPSSYGVLRTSPRRLSVPTGVEPSHGAGEPPSAR
jgi:hypothetical protein